jgi:hypothetical protein
MRLYTTFQFILVFLGVLLFSNSCQSLDRFTKYNVTYKAKPVLKAYIPERLDTFYQLTSTFEFDFEDDMDFRAVKIDKIERAELFEIQLAIKTDSEVKNFNFVHTLRVYLDGEGFQRRLIAEVPEVGISEPFLVFRTEEVDGILNLLKKDTFDLILEFNTDEDKEGEVHFEFDTRFEIDAEQFFI